ncbi:Extensin family protein [Ancylobacter novellus DSM 506]|uniref:Extensin family protein n=1 Tax=Ancylobacter novellus (strain ATCC 8093 / DSM 506 / JCM 20403 / CCM 1077 / IAM 12100 / NBRC 12443 / NCIMB 10456) TaxID=639283 RepID=D7A1Z3_ANCN5|nr:extensin family protein [Ancylobacter novellus]ADH87609.1 Extensin family protein [Ancylobacter novellus DSM 506]
MDFRSLPFIRLPFPRRVAPILAVGLLLAGASPLAADDLTRSIDRAGNAINRQLGDFFGVTPERPAKRRPATKSTATAKPVDGKVPLPPSRPGEADQQAALTSQPEEASAPKPEAKPAVAEPDMPKPDIKAASDPGEAKPDTPTPSGERAATSDPGEAKPDTPAPSGEREVVVPPPAAPEPPAAASAPLPPPAPERLAALPPPAAGPTAEPAETARAAPVPTICPELSNEDIGVFTPTEVKTTEPACTLDRGVVLSAVRMKDGRLVQLQPAAELRCEMAASVARWLREKVEPAVATLGSPLDKVLVAGSLQCRSRNHVAGAKISEHGRGNALDTHGYELKDGRRFVIGPPSMGSGEHAMPVDFQEKLKASACADFTTILGPGSDGYHEQHLHVDRAERRSGAVLCQWATARVEAVPPKPPVKPAEAKAGEPAASDAPPEEGATPDSAGKSQ